MQTRRSFIRGTLAAIGIAATTPAIVKAGDVFVPMVMTSPLELPSNIVPSSQVEAVINHLLCMATGEGQGDWFTHIYAEVDYVHRLGNWVASRVVHPVDGSDKPVPFFATFKPEFDMIPEAYRAWLDIIAEWLDGNELNWAMVNNQLRWTTEVMFHMIEKNWSWVPNQD